MKDLDDQPGFGTLDWLVERYYRSNAFTTKVSARSAPEYRRALRLVLDHQTKRGARVGAFKVTAMSARAVDKLYNELQRGKRAKRRLRQATLHHPHGASVGCSPSPLPERRFRSRTRFAASSSCMARNHAAGHARGGLRASPGPDSRRRDASGGRAADRFEWHQRPENIIAGHLTWADWRPADRPNADGSCTHKTGEVSPAARGSRGAAVSRALRLLDTLERLGVPIVLMRPRTRQDCQALHLAGRREIACAGRQNGRPADRSHTRPRAATAG